MRIKYAFISFILCLLSIFLEIECRDKAILITIEKAKSPHDIAWGLMGRQSLPQNHGMLFFYSAPRKTSLWMFNCRIDLSAAIIDKDRVIQEIHELSAYPEMMDPLRPVTTIEDINRYYPPRDPIRRFFDQRRIISLKPAMFVLEMNAYWFQENGIQVGDVIDYDENSSQCWIISKKVMSDER